MHIIVCEVLQGFKYRDFRGIEKLCFRGERILVSQDDAIAYAREEKVRILDESSLKYLFSEEEVKKVVE